MHGAAWVKKPLVSTYVLTVSSIQDLNIFQGIPPEYCCIKKQIMLDPSSFTNPVIIFSD